MKATILGTITLFAVALAIPALPAMAQTIWYVNDDAQGTNTGTSWDNAFTSLQTALSAASPGQHIWVASGTYKPGASTSAFFQLRVGVSIYGGLAGDEDPEYFDPEEDPRYFVTNETILSGEIGTPGLSDNCLVIVRGASNNNDAVLDGFTIKRSASHALRMYDHASPQLRNLLVSDSVSTGNGAGMLCEQESEPSVKSTTFTNCQASSGGGAVAVQNSSPDFRDCTFSQNSTTSATNGGALRIVGTSSPTLRRCTLEGNTALGSGGAIAHEGDLLRLIRCDFIDNHAGTSPDDPRVGGALQNLANATVVDCFFAGNSATGLGGAVYSNAPNKQVTLTNCAFSGNSANTQGGAVFTDWSDPRFTNCTFHANQAGTSGGGLFRNFGDPILTNCILWGNTAGSAGDEAAQITGSGRIFLVDYNCVQGLDTLASRPGNIGTNPLFVDAEGGGRHRRHGR